MKFKQQCIPGAAAGTAVAPAAMAPRNRVQFRLLGRVLALALAAITGVAGSLPARAAEDRPVRSRVAPVYPEIAKRMRIAGTVRVEATVDAAGKVTSAKAVSGSHTLGPAAEEAVIKWKYAPAEATSTVEVDVNFTLNQ